MLTIHTETFIDGRYNFLEEELSNFSSKGSYRNSLLAMYLRLLELKMQQDYKVSSFKLIESCSKATDALAILNIKGTEVDLAALQIWHFGEYYSWDILFSRVRKRESYADLMAELSVAYKKTITTNIMTYLLSIGDEESFSLDKKV